MPKKRFRVLKQPIEYRDPDFIEKLFRGCCALHNLILKHDKRDTIGQRTGDWVTAKDILANRDELEIQRATGTLCVPPSIARTPQ
eukprot:5374667-Prymnesium_polylepis.1